MEQDILHNYRPIPFWSWNDRLDAKELRQQIRWMKDMGIGGFFMHARSGLQTEYMSEEWMQCIELGATEAEKTGMQAWIYDENGWPSGFAGGKLLEDPENHDKLIVAKIGKFDENATVTYLVTEDRLIRTASCDSETDNYLNLYISLATSTADILNPAVVDRFISLTHSQYQLRFGDQFADKISGFFTDEPQYQRWGTPYTDMIAQYFDEIYHEDVLDGLGLLFAEKAGHRQFRYRYWKGMQALMLRNYAEKVYRWCDDRGIKLTGHYIEETSLGYQLMCCGGIMPFYEFEHIPGIDWLGRSTDNPLPAIQAASVAAQLGKKQVLSETFACCGWDVTPAQLRSIAGFQYVHGVNVMCHHLIPYSERGSRKYDYPAHFSTENPWINDGFRDFNEYFTRLGYLLGEGTQKTEVAVLHPIRSAYFSYKRDLESTGFGTSELDASLLRTNKLLESNGIAYHFLDETILAKHGFVEDDKMCCGQCRYTYLVLPTIYTMDKTTEQLLHTYICQGGKVLLLDDKPSYLESEPYDYTYLSSNCTLADIVHSMPFHVENTETELCYAYRILEGKHYIYVMNPSATRAYTQKFDCGEDIRSFKRIHLEDLSTEQIPLTLTLSPGEDALLLLSPDEAISEKPLGSCVFRLDRASVSFDRNALPIDHIHYSYDGIHYSDPWPCPGLFKKLLKERYEGNIYFQYEFEVQKKPDRLLLSSENSHDICAYLNDILLTERLPVDKEYENVYDISKIVKTGCNCYTVKVFWHQDESVYTTLFGENLTEGLKNCIAYDSELQPVYLLGDFGVYPKIPYENTEAGFVKADQFVIGETPAVVSDITLDGFPFFAGKMTVTQKVWLDQTNILLEIPGEYQIVQLSVNGVDKGKLLFERKLDISDVAVVGENEIEACFWISNRNLCGPHHFNGGKTWGVSSFSFEMGDDWVEDKNEAYHHDYDLKSFYK